MDVTPEMDIMNHETFGPVLPIMVMDDVDAMVEEANRSHLACSPASSHGMQNGVSSPSVWRRNRHGE